MYKMIQKLVFATILSWSMSAAAEQVIFADFAGQKGGAIEKLYSVDGLADLTQQVTAKVKNPGDSVYFIIEVKDFSKAIIVNAYVANDGTLSGRMDALERHETVSDFCLASNMATLNIDDRADGCYYNDNDYSVTLGVVGPVQYASPADFLAQVKGWASQNNPLLSAYELIKKTPALDQKRDQYVDVIRTNKLYPFLNVIVLGEAGYTSNLSEAMGWAQGAPNFEGEQAKTLAAIHKLIADNKMYLSKNVSCSAKTTGDGEVVARTTASEACEAMTLMPEWADQIYFAMEAAGYTFDATTGVWVSKAN
jgi:hypothetical protein